MTDFWLCAHTHSMGLRVVLSRVFLVGQVASLACVPRAELDEYAHGGPQGSVDTTAGGSAGLAGTGADRPSEPTHPELGGGDLPLFGPDAAAPIGEATRPRSDAAAAETSGPLVSSSVPANEAVGVRRDTSLSIAFSEPMDRDSVEAAFVSGNLPAGAATFHWDAAGTLLNIVLGAPLEYASGSDPNQLPALRYGYWLSSVAQDLSGRPLPETHLSFSTLRELQLDVSVQPDPALSGNWRSDDIYGTDSCAPGGANICVGDSSFGPNANYRGFLSYDLSALVAALEVTQATLEIPVASILGTPFTGLGPLGLEHTSFTAIAPEAFLASASPSLASAASAQAGTALSLDVLAAVQADLASGGLSQYRLRFQTASDVDAATDLLFLQRTSAALRVTYLLP